MASKDLYDQATALHQAGRLEEAETVYRRLLEADPLSFVLHQRLGVLQAQARRPLEALALIAKALELRPGDPAALVNYGNVLSLLGRHEEAVANYDKALASAPDAETLNNRGNALQSLRRLPEALASYRQATRLHPADVRGLYKEGVILGEMGRADEAMACYDRVLKLSPNHAEALNNRGFIWWLNKQDYGRAIADLQHALRLDPGLPYGPGAVLHLKMYAADWTDFDAQKKAIASGIRRGLYVARPFMFQAVADDVRDLQTCARLYARDLFPEIATAPRHQRDGRARSGKIHLGYLSGEFRDQATAILTAGLYERHDRSRFALTAIDNGSADGSAMSRRLKQTFDTWIDIGALNDAEAAEKIRAAGIDILVNLNGWFGKHRMGVFARRPAPLQVNYLGFPGTLGASYMDYIIADRIVIPPHEEQFYDESVVTLPGCYQANDDRGRPIAPMPTRSQAGLPEEGFVFCNFNQSYKLGPQIFASWMRILKQVEASILWLLEGPAPLAENIARHARRHAIAPERIVLAPNKPPSQHLARLQLADLFLDGLPYNAHTTASDALWAGVPLLTCRGTTFPGRVASSLLLAADLPELVTDCARSYETLAVRLASDPPALAALRARLGRDCRLFNTDMFRRNIEAAYEKMWRHWLAGEKPKGFAVGQAP